MRLVTDNIVLLKLKDGTSDNHAAAASLPTDLEKVKHQTMAASYFVKSIV